MTIDAINTSVVSGVGAVGAVGASRPAEQQPFAQQDAAVVTISDEVLAQRRAADEQALLDAADAANAAAAADAANREAAKTSAPATPDNPTLLAALDALDEASRENQRIEAEVLATARTHAADADAAARTAAADAGAKQDAIQTAAINAGIQTAYGALATPITGDPALRQPGLDVIA